MKPSPDRLRLIRGFAVIAGLMDFITGLGLIGAPDWMLQVMQVPVPGVEAMGFVRWTGVFVWSVGASYLWAVARGGIERLRTTFEFTLLIRTAVSLFVVGAWATHTLAAPWLSVAATDGLIAGVQAGLLHWLRKERGRG